MLQIEMRPLAEIKPYSGNPRANDQAVDAVAASIREYGWRAPIVVDGEGVVICGHTRLKAAKKQELAEAPVHVARDLSPEQVRAYRLADNKTGEIAEWDFDLLPVELGALKTAGYDLSLIGFSGEELARFLQPAGPAAGEVLDEAPAPQDRPVSRRGEVYQLGPHRLLCGDAAREEDTRRLMAGETAGLMVTDPPYGVGYTGGTKDALRIENDDLGAGELRQLLAASFRAANGALKPGAAFYVFHAQANAPVFHAACAEAGWKIRQWLVWVKNALVLGRFDYHYRHEACLYGWTPGAARVWRSDRKQTTVMEFGKPARSAEHPTMKPVALLAYLIGNSCPPGGLALDPFCGSGSAIIACHHTGRRCFGIEIDPAYCDVARKRWAWQVHGRGCDWEAMTPACGLRVAGCGTAT